MIKNKKILLYVKYTNVVNLKYYINKLKKITKYLNANKKIKSKLKKQKKTKINKI